MMRITRERRAQSADHVDAGGVLAIHTLGVLPPNFE